jgi:hypothetical protein
VLFANIPTGGVIVLIQRQYFVDLLLAKGAGGPWALNTGAPSGALSMPRVFGVEEVSFYYLEALLTYEERWFYRHSRVNSLA